MQRLNQIKLDIDGNGERTNLETLANTDLGDDFLDLAALVERSYQNNISTPSSRMYTERRTSRHDLPVIEDTLGEGLSGSM